MQAPTSKKVEREQCPMTATCFATGAIDATLLQTPESLAEILLRASVLSGDRLKMRYPRLRKAVASGLEPAGALSAKQPKGKKRRKANDARGFNFMS